MSFCRILPIGKQIENSRKHKGKYNGFLKQLNLKKI